MGPLLTRESIIGRLRQGGLKTTSQRLAVIDVLIEKRLLHPGPTLIYREARKKNKGLSLSTVYATLDALSRLGVIKALRFDRAENRYEADPEEHVNLICGQCGGITDYRPPVAANREDVTDKTGFTITDGRLEYYGYCRECRDKQNSRPKKKRSIRE